MPPASVSMTFVLLMASKSEVLPWSTWPITTTTGERSSNCSGASSKSLNKMSSSVKIISLSTIAPKSSAIKEAVSKSTDWLIEAITPSIISFLITSVAGTSKRSESSPTAISSGIFTVMGPLFTFSSFCAFALFFTWLLSRNLLPFFSFCFFTLSSDTFVGTNSSMTSSSILFSSTTVWRVSTWRTFLPIGSSAAGVLSWAGLGLDSAACLSFLPFFAGFGASGCFPNTGTGTFLS